MAQNDKAEVLSLADDNSMDNNKPSRYIQWFSLRNWQTILKIELKFVDLKKNIFHIFARKKKADIFVAENWIVFKLVFTLRYKVLLYTVSPHDDRKVIILSIWTYRLS